VTHSLRFVCALAVALAAQAACARPPQNADWPINGGPGNARYSPLTQITKDNVSQLKVAWTYDSQDAFTASEMQSNVIVVDTIKPMPVVRSIFGPYPLRGTAKRGNVRGNARHERLIIRPGRRSLVGRADRRPGRSLWRSCYFAGMQ